MAYSKSYGIWPGGVKQWPRRNSKDAAMWYPSTDPDEVALFKDGNTLVSPLIACGEALPIKGQWQASIVQDPIDTKKYLYIPKDDTMFVSDAGLTALGVSHEGMGLRNTSGKTIKGRFRLFIGQNGRFYLPLRIYRVALSSSFTVSDPIEVGETPTSAGHYGYIGRATLIQTPEVTIPNNTSTQFVIGRWYDDDNLRSSNVNNIRYFGLDFDKTA